MDHAEFDIEILPSGEVKVHVKGVQGRQCLAYAELLAEIVGVEKSRSLTSEYYEEQQAVRIQAQQRRK